MSRLFSQHRSVAGGHLINQPRIFVSHGHKDDEFTQLLVDDLHRAGAVVWVDVAGITHGNFMQRTDEALTHYGWLVLLLTDNALASPYVKDEVCAALHWVKQGYMYDVVPVLSAPCTPGTIPPQWDVLQRHDAIQGYAAALAGVVRAIGLSARAQPAPAQDMPPMSLQVADQLINTILADGAQYSSDHVVVG